jgi:hypothetical protein
VKWADNNWAKNVWQDKNNGAITFYYPHYNLRNQFFEIYQCSKGGNLSFKDPGGDVFRPIPIRVPPRTLPACMIQNIDSFDA